MADVDRRVKLRSWKDSFPYVQADVHGNVEVERGDLMFLDDANGLRSRGASVADWYTYPIEKIDGTTRTLASNISLAKNHFLGVAAGSSDSGVTEKIAIYVGGLFKFPLKSARNVKVGHYASPCGSGVTLYNQKLALSSTSPNQIGKACSGGNWMSTVDVLLSTKMMTFAVVDEY